MKKSGKNKKDENTDCEKKTYKAIGDRQNTKRKNVYGAIAGVAAGLANGLFGGGGGMIIVPMLTTLLKKEPKVAHATAIMIILPMSLISGMFYAAFGNFDLRIGIPVGAGVIAGGIFGAFILNKLSSRWVVVLFATVMAVAGIKMLIF